MAAVRFETVNRAMPAALRVTAWPKAVPSCVEKVTMPPGIVAAGNSATTDTVKSKLCPAVDVSLETAKKHCVEALETFMLSDCVLLIGM